MPPEKTTFDNPSNMKHKLPVLIGKYCYFYLSAVLPVRGLPDFAIHVLVRVSSNHQPLLQSLNRRLQVDIALYQYNTQFKKFELNACILKEVEQGQVKGQGLLQASLTMPASQDALAELERY